MNTRNLLSRNLWVFACCAFALGACGDEQSGPVGDEAGKGDWFGNQPGQTSCELDLQCNAGVGHVCRPSPSADEQPLECGARNPEGAPCREHGDCQSDYCHDEVCEVELKQAGVPPHVLGTLCFTPTFWCEMDVAGRIGDVCQCYSRKTGWVWGTLG